MCWMVMVATAVVVFFGFQYFHWFFDAMKEIIQKKIHCLGRVMRIEKKTRREIHEEKWMQFQVKIKPNQVDVKRRKNRTVTKRPTFVHLCHGIFEAVAFHLCLFTFYIYSFLTRSLGWCNKCTRFTQILSWYTHTHTHKRHCSAIKWG